MGVLGGCTEFPCRKEKYRVKAYKVSHSSGFPLRGLANYPATRPTQCLVSTTIIVVAYVRLVSRNTQMYAFDGYLQNNGNILSVHGIIFQYFVLKLHN